MYYLKGKVYNNNPYNTKFSKIKHISAIFSKNNIWGMAYLGVCVCVCERARSRSS